MMPLVPRLVLRGAALFAATLTSLLAQEPVAPDAAGSASVIVIVGAPGEDEFAAGFDRQGQLWREAALRGGAKVTVIGEDPSDGVQDLQRVKAAIAAEPKEGPSVLWIVLLGHGTFDGKLAKFNLRGDDLTATDLALELQPFRRPLAIINAASASAPFMNVLAGPDRIVVTSTRSGYEQNYARFGQFMAEAVGDPKGDLDKDGQTSLLEAFLSAAQGVNEFYKTEGRLATEHALIDDTGDGRGTPAEWFRGVRSTRKPAQGVALDGLRAHQLHLVPSEAERRLTPAVRLRRDELEREIEELRGRKERMLIDDYYAQLEEKFLELARLYPPASRDS